MSSNLSFMETHTLFGKSEHIRIKLIHFHSGKTWAGVWINIKKNGQECFAIVGLADIFAREDVHNFKMVDDTGAWITIPAKIANECILVIEGDERTESGGN